MKKEKTRSETDEEKIDEKNNESMPEGDEETEDDEEEEQREEGEVGQQYGKPTIGGSPSTDVRNDAFAGGSGEDPSGAQHSEGVRSSDGTRASGTKMVCEVEGLDMIWRNEQAELQFPADAPDDAPKQVPANTRVCLVGSIADDGKGQSLVPLASAPPTEYGGPVFEFELNAKSMIVTDESAKPLKLSKWWLDLPNDDAGDNAGAVWWHQASLDDDKSTVCREAFLKQCADRKEGWQYWWRGDRIMRDDRGFSAGGGLGLLNDIADAGWRIKNERLANKWREDDRNEEAKLLARVHELREERLGGSRSYLR